MAARRHAWALNALQEIGAFHYEIPGLVKARFPAIGLQVRLTPICRGSGVTICRAYAEGRAGHARAFHVSYGP